MVKLRGITWDNPRGYAPLVATSEAFSKLRPNIKIVWKKRSLKEFGDYPIEKLVKLYDIILIDHPFVGQAYKNNLLVPLEEYLNEEFLKVQENESVGKSYESYRYNGKQLALPIDAAALVSAAKTEEIKEIGLSIPRTFNEIFEFAYKLPKNRFVAIPMCPTDIWCLFLTLCAQIGGENFFDISRGIPERVGLKAIRDIISLKTVAHPDSINMNPINVLDKMADEDDIIYSPFLFGYINYSKKGWRKKKVEFFDAPLKKGSKISTVLGGVGIAVSTYSKNIKEAVEYIKYVTTPDIQKGIYFKSGGQPGQLSAWESETINAETNNFFKNTITTMRMAYMRPRIPKWNYFQETSSNIIHKGVSQNIRPETIVEEVNVSFKKACLDRISRRKRCSKW
jgi:multiple sugar transport system substrate-binding protein